MTIKLSLQAVSTFINDAKTKNIDNPGLMARVFSFSSEEIRNLLALSASRADWLTPSFFALYGRYFSFWMADQMGNILRSDIFDLTQFMTGFEFTSTLLLTGPSPFPLINVYELGLSRIEGGNCTHFRSIVRNSDFSIGVELYKTVYDLNVIEGNLPYSCLQLEMLELGFPFSIEDFDSAGFYGDYLSEAQQEEEKCHSPINAMCLLCQQRVTRAVGNSLGSIDNGGRALMALEFESYALGERIFGTEQDTDEFGDQMPMNLTPDHLTTNWSTAGFIALSELRGFTPDKKVFENIKRLIVETLETEKIMHLVNTSLGRVCPRRSGINKFF